MRLAEVLQRAGLLDKRERWRAWQQCGDHDPATSPKIEEATPGAYYCSQCWTAFTGEGVAWNPPTPP